MINIIGNSHTLQRYVMVGLISGSLTGAIASILNLDFTILCIVVSAVAGWFSGFETNKPTSSTPV